MLSAPAFLELIIQANKEYLLQMNVSEEIARYIHIEMQASQDRAGIDNLSSVLMYNLDKERLEEALRKKLILRLLDSAQINIERERALSEALRAYFGGKFNHRFQLLFDSTSDEATTP